jgi:hypothetical protein
MNNAGLNRRLRKDGHNGFWEALEPIDDGDADVLDAAVFACAPSPTRTITPSTSSAGAGSSAERPPRRVRFLGGASVGASMTAGTNSGDADASSSTGGSLRA